MNAPIAEISKQLRQLPYSDMKELARALAEKFEAIRHLDGSVPIDRIMAEALEEVGKIRIESADTTKEDSRMLATIFKRKRQISVDRVATGWKVAIPTLGISALGLDLRATIADLLDQAVVSRILLGDKK